MSTRRRTIRITLTVDDDTYARIANSTWTHLDGLHAFSPFEYRVHHDGDQRLSDELNQRWDHKGTNRWA